MTAKTALTPLHSRGAFGIALLLACQAAGVAGAQTTIMQSGAGMPMIQMPGGPGGTKPLEVGSGLVVGRVVDSDGTSPVSGTIVTLSLPGFAPVRVLSDGQGRFAYRALPKGSYSLAASRPGYVDGAHGRLRPGGALLPVELTESQQRVGNITVMMWRYAALAGTVLDEHNEPMVGVSVRALRRDFVAGRRRLAESGADTTDDRGQFRIGSLEPGEYVVVLPMTQRPSLDALIGATRDGAGGGGGGAMMFRVEATASMAAGGGGMVIATSMDSSTPSAGTTPEGVPLTYQTEFFTAALSASRATAVTLQAGEERTAVDFRLLPVPALSLGGTVIGPGGPMANTQVQLIPAEAEDLVSPVETASTSTDGNGQFSFTGVPSGNYTLRAQRTPRFAGGPGQTVSVFTRSDAAGQIQFAERAVAEMRAGAAALPTEPTLWAETSVSIGTRALVDLSVTLREGLTVSGQLSFMGAATPPTAEARGNIGIVLEPADGRTAGMTSIARGRVDASGAFTTMGVPAGKYILRVTNAPQGWTLRSAMFGGRDITETAVDLKDENAGGVVLSFNDRPIELTGLARDASGNGDPTASILVFPVDPAGWVDTGSQPRRLRQVRASKDGSFKLGALPPGEYHAVAIAGTAPRGWQDPQYLDAVARSATQVRMSEGETRAITLTSVKGPA